MVHHSRIQKIVIDVPPDVHDREVAFWGAATGRRLERFDRFPEYSGSAIDDHGTWLLVQRIQQGTPRVHLDIHTDDLAAEVARLRALGAEMVESPDVPWQVMRDPAGLPFCVIPNEPGRLHDGNSRRWE